MCIVAVCGNLLPCNAHFPDIYCQASFTDISQTDGFFTGSGATSKCFDS